MWYSYNSIAIVCIRNIVLVIKCATVTKQTESFYLSHMTFNEVNQGCYQILSVQITKINAVV